MSETWSAAGLFAGIGGIERGLAYAGVRTELLCEIDPGAVAVLKRRMPDASLHTDIRTLRSLPRVDLVAAGFPCQDLSQAGTHRGDQRHAERAGRPRLPARAPPPRRPEMAVPGERPVHAAARPRPGRCGTSPPRSRTWATGGPTGWSTRGPSACHSAATGCCCSPPAPRTRARCCSPTTPRRGRILTPIEHACGFYWTEGLRGLGWAVDAVPTLKGGSTIGIASPPAIRLARDRRLVTPGIEDAERLQGFPAGWTAAAVEDAGTRPRAPVEAGRQRRQRPRRQVARQPAGRARHLRCGRRPRACSPATPGPQRPGAATG